MDNKCVEKLLETVAFSNGCICSVELIRWEHTHFHPSGNLYPSQLDTAVTEKMLKLCLLMGIPLQDHVIVGGENKTYFSFKEKEMMQNPHMTCCTDYRALQFDSELVAERGR